MPNFFTTFEGYTLNQQPSDFTQRDGGANFFVQSITGATGGVGLEIPPASGDQVLTWDLVDNLSADVDILSRFRIPVLPTGNSLSIGIGGRIDDAIVDGQYRTGYQCGQHCGLQWFDVQHNGSTYSNVDTGVTVSANVWFCQRLRLNGSNIKGKIWDGNEGDEPGAWNVEYTDSTKTAAGTQGFVFKRHPAAGQVYQVDMLAVATEGDIATFSAGGPVKKDNFFHARF